MSDEEHNFESAASGASDTVPQQCSALRKNGYVVMKGRACKIVDMSTSKTGKHGHAKVCCIVWMLSGYCYYWCLVVKFNFLNSHFLVVGEYIVPLNNIISYLRDKNFRKKVLRRGSLKYGCLFDIHKIQLHPVCWSWHFIGPPCRWKLGNNRKHAAFLHFQQRLFL